MAKLELDESARAKLESDLTEIVSQLSGQRVVLGDRVIRWTVKLGLMKRRKKYRDKKEFDRIVREHKVFGGFCELIGLKI
jgi:hypothetical protein